MRFAIVDGNHIITLSRRNLQAMLSKLDDPISNRTLIKDEQGGLRLVLHAEEDDEHYKDRPEGGPGPMVDRTELQLEVEKLKKQLKAFTDLEIHKQCLNCGCHLNDDPAPTWRRDI